MRLLQSIESLGRGYEELQALRESVLKLEGRKLRTNMKAKAKKRLRPKATQSPKVTRR